MRNRPEDLGITAYGTEGRPRPLASPPGNPVAVAFRALGTGIKLRDFWLIAGGYFVCGATTNGLIGTHLIPACVDHGLSEVAGAGVLAATGVFALIGGTISGWLSDRWDNRLLLFAYYGFRGLSLIYLPFAFDMPAYGLWAFSMVYGLDWSASGPPTVRLLSQVVGAERIGIMVAWITVIHRISSASAAYLGASRGSPSAPISKSLCCPACYCSPPRSWCSSSASAAAAASGKLSRPRRCDLRRARIARRSVLVDLVDREEPPRHSDEP